MSFAENPNLIQYPRATGNFATAQRPFGGGWGARIPLARQIRYPGLRAFARRRHSAGFLASAPLKTAHLESQFPFVTNRIDPYSMQP